MKNRPLIDSYETYYAKRRPIVTTSAIDHDGDAKEIAGLFTNSVRTTANNVRNLRLETLKDA
jgi:hypothetical protein